MKLKPLLILAFILFSGLPIFGDAIIYSEKDTLVVSRTDENLLLYKHKANNQQKIEDICKILGCNVSNVRQMNQLEESSVLRKQDEILIPVNEKALITEAHHKYEKQKYVPVVYEVRPNDNLFRISRHYFFQSLEELMARNGMADYNLSIGDRIHVGWLNIKELEIPPKAIKIDEIDVEDESEVEEGKNENENEEENEDGLKDETVDSTSVIVEEPIIYMASRGVGMWDKKVRDNGKHLALHPKAKIGSTIELKNRMLNRTVKAKVIGRIPENVYPDDISILVGPSAAKSLGVIDAKFSVEIRYIP